MTPDLEIYFSGGLFPNNSKITQNFYKLNETNLSLVELPAMKIPRLGHNLIYIESFSENSENIAQINNDSSDDIYSNNNPFILAIGGVTFNERRTNSCEKYCLKKKNWEIIPSMNKPRAKSASTIFNKNFVFICFGTDSQGNTLDSVEKIRSEKFYLAGNYISKSKLLF